MPRYAFNKGDNFFFSLSDVTFLQLWYLVGIFLTYLQLLFDLLTYLTRIIKIILNKPINYPNDDLYSESELVNIRKIFAFSLIVCKRKNVCQGYATLSILPFGSIWKRIIFWSRLHGDFYAFQLRKSDIFHLFHHVVEISMKNQKSLNISKFSSRQNKKCQN